ncbi:uncharacterized protein LOC115745394 isoform X2 [Rhodamnia argentea]|uniref:Uncharacterized protein LOC115745394 isoform X2 n=1 Tax=Rhodamnia argentea TaxID=178133 RepID=A0A8B8PPT3_9MYRT|nr:uncharacterized protein LOC115745394 isoform X2 [Rhodamnia argentea]
MVSRAPPEMWTDEKHCRFLNSVEASFVRAVFGSKNENDSSGDHDGVLRLDRHLPDCSESTQDLQSQRRKKSTTSSSDGVGPRLRSDGRQDKRSRKISSQPKRDSPRDQVGGPTACGYQG